MDSKGTADKTASDSGAHVFLGLRRGSSYRLSDAGQLRRSRGCRPRRLVAMPDRRQERRRRPGRVSGDHDDAGSDQRGAVRPRAARDVHRTVASGAGGNPGERRARRRTERRIGAGRVCCSSRSSGRRSERLTSSGRRSSIRTSKSRRSSSSAKRTLDSSSHARRSTSTTSAARPRARPSRSAFSKRSSPRLRTATAPRSRASSRRTSPRIRTAAVSCARRHAWSYAVATTLPSSSPGCVALLDRDHACMDRNEWAGFGTRIARRRGRGARDDRCVLGRHRADLLDHEPDEAGGRFARGLKLVAPGRS